MNELTRFVGLMFSIFVFIGALIFAFMRPLFNFYLGAVTTIFLFGVIFLIIAAHNHSLMGHLTDAFKSQMEVHSSMNRAVGQIVTGQGRVQAELIRFASTAVRHNNRQLPVSPDYHSNPFALIDTADTTIIENDHIDDLSDFMEITQWMKN